MIVEILRFGQFVCIAQPISQFSILNYQFNK